MVPESIESLILKSNILFLGKPDEGLDSISKAEELLNSLTKNTNSNPTRIKLLSLTSKSWCYYYKGNYDKALDLALKSRL